MHFDSKSFVCGSNSCSESVRIGYKCSLNQWYSKMMVFKVLPKLKSRNIGESIQYRDLLLFESSENESYLSICEGQESRMFTQNYSPKSDNPFRPPLSISGGNYQTYDCYLSLIPGTAFTCVLHTSVHHDRRTLIGQELIRMIHSETDGKVGADISYKKRRPEVWLQENNKKFPLDDHCGQTIWEVEHVKVSDNGKPFRLDNYDEGHESKYSSPIILKHLVSNLRMEFRKLEKDSLIQLDQEKDIPVLEEYPDMQSSERGTIWKAQFMYLYPLVKMHDEVQTDSTYFIRNSEDKFLKAEHKKVYSRDKLIKKFKESDDEHKGRFEPVSETALGQRKIATCFTPNISTKDSFFIKKVDEEECYQIHFLKSAVQMLSWVSNYFKNPPYSKLESKIPLSNLYYIRVVKILQKITTFVTDKDENSTEEIQGAMSSDPNEKKQQLIKDMGLIDLIMEIIYYPLKNSFYSLPDLKITCPFTPVVRACYMTLKKVIEEYRPNELYASQWLRVIIEHSLNTTAENDIMADQTMRELIDNNRTILESRIDKDTVKMYINSMKSKSHKDDKYVVILRALCICDGEAIVANQKLLTELILEDEEARKILLIKFRLTEEGVKIASVDGNHYQDLQAFVEESKTNQIQKLYYVYMLSMTNLLGEMCFDRNYLSIELLQPIYPINLCLNVLVDERHPYEVREAFGRLMTHLWINVSPFYKIWLPNPIRTFDGLSDKLSFSHFQGRKIIYDKVKAYIPRFIKNFTQKPAISDNQEVQLLNTLLEIML